MDSLNFLKKYFESLISTIDSGVFFTKPLKWIYIFMGVVVFLVPLYFVYYLFDKMQVHRLFDNSAWNTIVGFLAIILFVCFLLVIAYLNFVFWMNRKNKLDVNIRKGDEIVALPLFADFLQTSGEAYGFLIGIIPPIAMLFAFVFFMLTGEMNFYHDCMFLKAFAGLILFSAVFAILGWFSTFGAHVIAERIRLYARITNDLKDVADIHRAATIQEPSLENEVQVSQDSTSEFSTESTNNE